MYTNDSKMCIDVYQSRHVSQVKIKFRLKFFNPGWFYISVICLLAFIIQELGLGDEGNNFLWESMYRRLKKFNQWI